MCTFQLRMLVLTVTAAVSICWLTLRIQGMLLQWAQPRVVLGAWASCDHGRWSWAIQFGAVRAQVRRFPITSRSQSSSWHHAGWPYHCLLPPVKLCYSGEGEGWNPVVKSTEFKISHSVLRKQDFLGVGLFALSVLIPTVAQDIWEEARLKHKWSCEKEERNLSSPSKQPWASEGSTPIVRFCLFFIFSSVRAYPLEAKL